MPDDADQTVAALGLLPEPPPVPADPRHVLLGQLWRQQTSLAVINAGVALLFAAVAGNLAPLSLVGGWLGYMLAVQAIRLVWTGHWPSGRGGGAATALERGDGPAMGWRLTACSALSGAGWGAMGWLFLGIEPATLDFVVIFVLAGVAAGGITALPAHPPAFAAFLLLTLLPLAGRLALDARDFTDAMALLTIAYAIGIGHLGRQAQQAQLAHAGLSVANQELVVSLHQAGVELERRVDERTRELQATNDRMAAEIRRRQESEAKVSHLLHHDPLTNLPNRLVLADRLDNAIGRAQRQGAVIAVALFDVDRFKAVNDTYGHLAADSLLKALADRLRPALRASDTLARMGGDEFAAVFPDIKGIDDADRLGAKLLAAMAEPFAIDGRTINVSLSIGIALYPLHGLDRPSLLGGADLALYEAKKQGRSRHRLLSGELLERARTQRRIERELSGAAGRGELRLDFQPQISVSRNRVIGAEALVRWAHPERGLLAPASFVPAAEAAGLLAEIDDWVIARACRHARAWQGYGHPVRVAVNLSPLDFRQPHLAARIAEHLARTGLAPSLLDVEITESAYLDCETCGITQQLRAIKDLGVRIAIDDFGTGYASLAYLRWLPVDVIKIDRSFIANIAQSRHDEAIVAATVSLATALDKTVIAEGVETDRQLEVLKRLGCDKVQGYLLGRPASEEQLRQRLAA